LSYQEFSNLGKPLALKDDPFKASAENKAMYWAEFLLLEHAHAIATYDHPFFGRWPAITRNEFGKGTMTYEGTYLSDDVQKGVLLDVLASAGLVGEDQRLPAPVRAKHGVNTMGKKLHYYLNYSSEANSFNYAHGAGVDLLTGLSIAHGQQVQLKPWDLGIVEEQ
jgi:beta-galactosidase